MPTNTPGTTARRHSQQQTHFLRADFTFGVGNGGVVAVGTIPAGAIVVGGGLHVDTAFVSGTAQTVDVGYAAHGSVTADPDGLATALAAGTIGFKPLDELGATTNRRFQADTAITATVALTGTAPSAGVGSIIVEYVI
jgi:hypothetical protein